MSDVTHYARARKTLESELTEASVEGATLNALLAVSTAARETAGEIRNGLHGLDTRLRDLANHGADDAGLVSFTTDTGPVWISIRHVVAVEPAIDMDDLTIIRTIDGRWVMVEGDMHATVGRLGVAI